MIPGGLSSGEKMLEVMNYPIGLSTENSLETQREEFEIGTKKRKQVLKQNNYKLKKNVYDKYN